MNGLFVPPFTGFGAGRLYPWPESLPVYTVQVRRGISLRSQVRRDCPRHAGVYGMVNGRGELIYVGKAKSLRARLLSYFRTRSRDPKAGRILRQTRSIVWEAAPSEFAALLRELELIRRWRPHFNVQGQPARRRRAYLCLGRRPAAYLYLASRPPAGALACFGPVYPGGRSREAVRRVNDFFGLRDCPQKQEMVFADQAELFPMVRAAGCIRYEIGTCLGPCAAACSRAAYGDRVLAAQAFLEGADRSPLKALERDMAAASAALQFERAAALRDKLTTLQWLDAHLERVRQARDRHTFIYPVAGHEGRDLWYLVRRGWVAAAVPAPHDPQTREVASDLLRSVYEQLQLAHQPAIAEESDFVLLVAAWFRKYPGELVRVLDPAALIGGCEKSSMQQTDGVAHAARDRGFA